MPRYNFDWPWKVLWKVFIFNQWKYFDSVSHAAKNKCVAFLCGFFKETLV